MTETRGFCRNTCDLAGELHQVDFDGPDLTPVGAASATSTFLGFPIADHFGVKPSTVYANTQKKK